MDVDLKPFIVTQRVRRPPGKGGARQPEASLARAAATALVKRRQRAPKPCGQPRNHVSAEAFAVLGPGAASESGMARTRPIRPGSQSRAKAREGSPGNLRDPVRARTKTARTRERRVNKAPGPTVASSIAGSADGEHERPRTMRNPEAKT